MSSPVPVDAAEAASRLFRQHPDRLASSLRQLGTSYVEQFLNSRVSRLVRVEAEVAFLTEQIEIASDILDGRADG